MLYYVVTHSAQPFERRAAAWDATDLPVPADVLVYTLDEWQALPRQGRFYQTLARETVWVYVRSEPQSRPDDSSHACFAP